MQISLTEHADRLIEQILILGYKDPIAVVEQALERMAESELSVGNLKTELLPAYYEQRQNQLKDYNNLRFETFQRIGRNIINFQRLEAALKYLSVINIEAHPEIFEKNIEEELKLAYEKKLKLTEKQTLGMITPKVINQLYGLHTDEDETDKDDIKSEEGKVSIKYRLLMSPESLKRRKEHLLQLVEERNKLVHQELSEVDFSSTASCYGLIKTLDEQNIRILQQLDELQWIFEVVYTLSLALRDVANTNEFSRWIHSEFDHVEQIA